MGRRAIGTAGGRGAGRRGGAHLCAEPAGVHRRVPRRRWRRGCGRFRCRRSWPSRSCSPPPSARRRRGHRDRLPRSPHSRRTSRSASPSRRFPRSCRPQSRRSRHVRTTPAAFCCSAPARPGGRRSSSATPRSLDAVSDAMAEAIGFTRGRPRARLRAAVPLVRHRARPARADVGRELPSTCRAGSTCASRCASCAARRRSRSCPACRSCSRCSPSTPTAATRQRRHAPRFVAPTPPAGRCRARSPTRSPRGSASRSPALRRHRDRLRHVRRPRPPRLRPRQRRSADARRATSASSTSTRPTSTSPLPRRRAGPGRRPRRVDAPRLPRRAAGPDRDGFFLTGDLGRLDAHGNLTITGRLKLLIDVGGLKVNPLEVEAVLAQHPGVAACVVVPMRVSETVCRLKAIVTPRPPERGADRASTADAGLAPPLRASG